MSFSHRVDPDLYVEHKYTYTSGPGGTYTWVVSIQSYVGNVGRVTN